MKKEATVFDKLLRKLAPEAAAAVLARLFADPKRGAGFTEGDVLRFAAQFVD
jgi:hypothetical protein